MVVEVWSIGSVKAYEKNPRNNDAAVAAVANSIKTYGFRQPIVVDASGTIICGHTRLKAAQSLGLNEVPVHVARDLSPDQVKALRIADNRLHELATWDNALLAVELDELKDLNIDVSLLGFDEAALTAIFAPPGTPVGLVDEDDVPEPPDAATTQRGDVWVLGEHRLVCGDSGDASDVDRLLAGQPIHLVNTDPPYNVNVEPRSNNAIAAGLTSFTPIPSSDLANVTAGASGHQQGADLNRYPHKAKPTTRKLRAKDRPLTNDFVSPDQFDRLLDGWFGTIARVLVPGGSFYIWGGYANCGNYPPVLKRLGLYFSQAVIWVKEHPVLTRKDFMGNHEWCFYGWREGAGHKFYGPSNVPDTWSIKKVSPQHMVHLTEKPVELAKRAIEYSSKPGEHVLDLFGGSGSTLIAAEMAGRRAFLMELDPLYCDVIVQRWEKFTGKSAKRIPASAADESDRPNENAATEAAAGRGA